MSHDAVEARDAATAGDHVATGVVASVVGFSSSFAVVLTALGSVGASADQARSGLSVLCLVMGALTVAVSWRTRMPVGVAWSTPGAAALLGAAAGQRHAFAEAVGGFVVTAGLLLATALLPVLRRAVLAVPPELSAGLLAGVLLPLCLAAAQAARSRPAVVLPVVLAWVAALRLARRLAVPVAVGVAAAAAAVSRLTAHGATAAHPSARPGLAFVTPHVSAWSVAAVAVPVYLTTMAGQNLPALALLRGFGYRPHLRPVLAATAAGTAVVAPFGGHAVNLAALTTALTASPDADPDPTRRWRATAASGAAYMVLGLASGAVVAAASLAPPELLPTLAGLALVATLADALARLADAPAAGLRREAALVTLLVTVSGVAVAGVGSAVIGLAAGLVVHAAGRARRGPPGRPVRRPTPDAGTP